MPHSHADALLRVENLTKRYGRLTALSGASFAVHSREVLGLIGPNGSGKTTLFECLGGVLPFDSGTIEPRVTGGWPNTFYLPDAITPWADRSLAWIQSFVLGFFGGLPADQHHINMRLGLIDLLQRPMRTLSKGQRKRALLAIGLLTPHPILLADEPFDGLDLRQVRDAATLLRETANDGRTLFLSIHQIADAAKVCDRFVLLSGGRVCGAGTLAELCERAKCPAGTTLEEVFLALT